MLAQLLRSGGFVSVELNAAGWLAVLAPGVIGGAILAVTLGLSLLLMLFLGAVGGWIIAVTIDRVKDRYRLSGYQYDPLTVAEIDQVARRARELGFDVEHAVVQLDPWVNGLNESGEDRTSASVFRVQNRHGAKLNAIVREVMPSGESRDG